MGAMKKKKGYKRKSAKGRSHEKSPASLVQGKEAQEVPDRKDLSQPASKKELSKKADGDGFAPKRYINIARQFLSDAKAELRKVTWPNRKELLSTTAIVIVLVLIISFFLGIVDFGLVKIIKNVIR